MSLQVWLPLTKDLRNQGLDNSGNFNIVGTFIDNGKIGSKAYNCTQQATATFNNLIDVSNYSISYWIYIDSSLTFSNYADMWGIQFNIGSSTAYMRDELRTSAGLRAIHMAKDASVGGNTYTYYGLGNRDDAKDKWSHVVLVKDDTKAYQYVNGSLIGTYDSSNWESSPGKMTGTIYIGQSGCSAYLNDFRIYDHCLSETEIKKLAQGLIVHYPLNRQGWGQENLIITNSMAPTSGTSGWSSAGTNWANSNVVSSGASNGHAIRCTYSGTTQVSGGIHHSTGVDKTTLTNGAAYTLSARIRASKACVATFQNELMTTGHTINLTTDWQIYTHSSTIDNTKTYQSNVIYVRAADATQNMWIECDWIKLEEGSVATPWIPNSADPLYTTMGLNDSIEYDISGFCNNGTRVGTFEWTSDTPKYEVSTEFNASYPNYIQVPNSSYALQGAEAMTISVWAYMDDWISFNSRIYSSTDSGGYNIEPSSSGSNLIWAVNVYTAVDKSTYAYASSNPNLYLAIAKSSLTPGWHMFTWVYDTTSTHLYIDGVLKASKTATSYGIHFSTTTPLIIGGEATGTGATTPYFTGKQSDFRIYATALSADDVKSLYQNCATIAADGTIYGQIRS